MDADVKAAYEAQRRRVEEFFPEANRVSNCQKSYISPSGTYKLDIVLYSIDNSDWKFSRDIVRRTQDEVVLADVKRAFPHFPYCWIEHPNGNEYLLCGEDIYGYQVINLTHGTIHTYFDEETVHEGGFCWIDFYPSPDKTILAVEGCYWGSANDIRFYDFSNPDSLPLPLIYTIQNLCEVSGWEDNDTFVVTREYEMRISDGAKYGDLSLEEQAVLDADDSLIGFGTETVRWKRLGSSLVQ